MSERILSSCRPSPLPERSGSLVSAKTTPTIAIEAYEVVSVFVALGFPISETILGPSGRVEFSFDDPTGELARILASHRDGSLLVGSKAMCEALRTVKRGM